MIKLGIAIGILALSIIFLIFVAIKSLRANTRQRMMDLDNIYKIYLRRSEQRAYIYWYDLLPTILPEINIQYWDTPAGTLYGKYFLTTNQLLERLQESVREYNFRALVEEVKIRIAAKQIRTIKE